MSELERLLACLPGPPGFVWDWAGLKGIPVLRDWFARMEKTPQDPRWHGEGDVWTHTGLVCEALAGLAAFRALPEEERRALALAALLHDVGKVRCTREAEGQWVSPHHGRVGAQLVRSLLWREFALCGTGPAQRLREAVCLLVRHHALPLHLLRDEDAPRHALRLAAEGELVPLFRLRSLCLLAEADTLGRVAPDTRERLDDVQLSLVLAEEEDCADGPYPFPCPRTQRALFSGTRAWKGQALHDDSWGEVTLLCGLPGTGKDTWIRENAPGLPVVSLDDLRLALGVPPEENQGRVVQAARELAREHLRARRPFVWNSTSLTPRRAAQVDLFEDYHARVRILYLETPWEENLRRNADRPRPVPEAVIGTMLDRLEPPGRGEAQTVEWRCV